MLEKLNNRNTFIIIGRAHSGTRILPDAMKLSGIFMGEPLNVASDLLPTEEIYEACRIFGNYVDYKGNFRWDFTRACTIDIPEEFQTLLTHYLKPLIESNSEKVGWKIPNNTFIYPWLTRLLPNASYIFWVRHPEGSCSTMTGVDRLEKWNIPSKKFLFHEWNYKMRVVSWKYHYDIVMHTPIPEHFLRIRFEDYVVDHEKTKKQVEEFIGTPLNSIPLNQQKVGDYSKQLKKKYPFLEEAMSDLGYD